MTGFFALYAAFIVGILVFTSMTNRNRSLRNEVENLRAQVRLNLLYTQRIVTVKLRSQPEDARKANELLDQAVARASTGGNLNKQKEGLNAAALLITQAQAIVEGASAS